VIAHRKAIDIDDANTALATARGREARRGALVELAAAALDELSRFDGEGTPATSKQGRHNNFVAAVTQATFIWEAATGISVTAKL
jgi:hypothetical protein